VKRNKVKLMLEEGVKILGIQDSFDRFVVLASHKHDGLFVGGILSGYALIRCKITSELYYLLTCIPQVYGILEAHNHEKNKVTPIEKLLSEVSEGDVNTLFNAILQKPKEGLWVEVWLRG